MFARDFANCQTGLANEDEEARAANRKTQNARIEPEPRAQNVESRRQVRKGRQQRRRRARNGERTRRRTFDEEERGAAARIKDNALSWDARHRSISQVRRRRQNLKNCGRTATRHVIHGLLVKNIELRRNIIVTQELTGTS